MADRSTINTFASRQYGVFNRRQASEAGYDRHAIQRRIASGEWIRLGPNVFCVSSAPPKWERQMAAAVLSRPRAIVGGGSAAFLLGLRGYRRGRPTIVIPEGSNARLSIGRVIRSKHFDALATAQVAGFEVTSMAETLMMLARDTAPGSLEDSLEDALLAGKVRIADFAPIIDRERGAVYFPDWRLAVEADGRTWHGRRRDEEKDRRRDAELAAQGIHVMRLTYDMLTEEPDRCRALIVAAGSHRSAQRVV